VIIYIILIFNWCWTKQ